MDTVEDIAGLGLCEHCGRLVSVSDYAGDESMNAKWLCTCDGELTYLSFGFDKGTSGAKKVLWVSPDGTWTDKKPTEDFQIGNLTVIVRMPRFVH